MEFYFHFSKLFSFFLHKQFQILAVQQIIIPTCIWFYPFNKISNIEQGIMNIE